MLVNHASRASTYKYDVESILYREDASQNVTYQYGKNKLRTEKPVCVGEGWISSSY